MKLLLLSAAQGPPECCLAVSLAKRLLIKEAEMRGIQAAILEQEKGSQANTSKSVLLKLTGTGAGEFASDWCGTLQWICQSPYRVKHRRKNWFFTGSLADIDSNTLLQSFSEREVSFESCRSSGPGGQHANKTSSAVRATHIETELSVKVQSERSQHANKRLAILLLKHKLNVQVDQMQASEKNERHLQHHSIERGNARRVFKGVSFKEVH